MKRFEWLKGIGDFQPPISVQIDLTLRCTARCIHCHQWAWPEFDDFEFNNLNSVFQKLQRWGVKTIIFSGGNPFLHPRIVDIIEACRQYEFEIGAITEGLSFDLKLLDSISKNLNWIRFSLDGPTSAIHDTLRNTPGLFDNAVKCIYELTKLKTKSKIGINFVIQKGNIFHMTEMLTLAKELNIDLLLFKLSHGEDPLKKYTLSVEDLFYLNSWIESHLSLGICKKTNLPLLNKLIGSYYDESGIVEGYPIRRKYIEEKINCFAPLFSIVIDSQGAVYPCCYLHADNRHWKKHNETRTEFLIGNILDDNILTKLQDSIREKVWDLPNQGYKECGSCTRSCQLNIELSNLYQRLATDNDSFHRLLDEYFASSNEEEEDIFL